MHREPWAIKAALALIVLPAIVGLGIIADSYARTRARTNNGIQRAWWSHTIATLSYIIWVLIVPLSLLGSANFLLAAAIWFVSAPFTARRFLSAGDVPVSLKDWVSQIPITVMGSRFMWPKILGSAGGLLVLLLSVLLPQTWWVTNTSISVWATLIFAITLQVTVFRAYQEAREQNRILASSNAAFLEAAATVLGVRVEELAPSLTTSESAEGTTVHVSPAPTAALARGEGRIGESVVSVLPTHMLTSFSPAGVTFTPADQATLLQRELLANSDGLVMAKSDPDEDGRVTLTLAPGVSPTAAERVEAWAHQNVDARASLIEWDPHHQTATVAVLSDAERRVRERLAAVLKITRPWDLAATVATVDDSGTERVNTITLHRLPPGTGGIRQQDRLDFWRQICESLPDGSNGWSVHEDETGVVTLTYGPPRSLVPMVPLASLLPDQITADDWATLPLGLNERGSTAAIDLTLGPHSLMVGPTGSGKTVGLLALAAAQLTRGHRLVIIDPTKRGLDFLSIRPFCAEFATTYADAERVIKAVYAEGQRRSEVLERYGAVKWSDLDPEVRAAENIQPLSVIIDEVGSLLLEPEIPKALPKDSPERADLESLAAQKAMLKMLTGKIARELRFAGVHLCVALQRPDAAILSGELRSNLTSAVQLKAPGKPISLDALRMVFAGDAAQEAYDTLQDLDDGQARGLGVVAGDGGDLDGIRVAYAPAPEVAALLRSRGVPDGVPLLNGGHSVAPQFGEVLTSPNAHEPVMDLGELDLSADVDTGTMSPNTTFDDLFDDVGGSPRV